MTQRTSISWIVRWCFVLREGDIRSASHLYHSLHAVVNFCRSDDNATSLPDEIRAAHERLARVAHIIHEQHLAAGDLLPVEAREGMTAVDIYCERRKKRRGSCDFAAAVEQPSHRVSEKCAACGWAGDDLRLIGNR